MLSVEQEARRKTKSDKEFKERVDTLLGSIASKVRLTVYQREGLYSFILLRERQARGGIIADEMGLGKTYSIAAAIKCNPMGRTLVLVPCSVLSQWEAALSVFGLTVVTVNNADTSFPQAGRSDNTRVFLATHSCLVKKEMHAFFCQHWDRIVVDEAHILRNPQALMNTNAMTLTGKVRWAVTATPIQNQIEDIVSLARFVGAPDPENAMDVCNNHMLRRTVMKLEERFTALKLPPLTCKYETVELSEQERAVYTTITKKYKNDMMACILRQRQVCVHAGVAVSSKKRASEIGTMQNLVSTKIKWVLDDLNRQSRATKSLIFCTWTLEIDLIRSTLVRGGYGVLVFDGSLDAPKREAVLNNFKLPSFNILILQIACGSVGLNLQHATRVYIMSPGWNPTTEMQAIARTHRQGQTQRVVCTRLVAKGTVEESVMYAQQRKSKLIDEATQDDMVSSRLLLRDHDLSFLANGKGVVGHEDNMDEIGVVRRPALSMEPKRRRKAAAVVVDHGTSREPVAHCKSVAASETARAPVSMSTAAASTSAATHERGPNTGATSAAAARTSSATLATSAASALTRKRSARRCTSTSSGSAGAQQKRLKRQEDTALAKSIRLATVF